MSAFRRAMRHWSGFSRRNLSTTATNNTPSIPARISRPPSSSTSSSSQQTLPTLTAIPSTNNTLLRPNNRTLGYALYGHPSGTPVFYLHGSPSCRLEAGDWHAAAVKQNIRLIGMDRWGLGLSSLGPSSGAGISITDWPADVLALATHLRLPRFHVMGVSGGGPYALACAATLPTSMLQGTGVVAGVAPREAAAAFEKSMSWDRRIAFMLNLWLPRRALVWTMDVVLGNVARGSDDAAWDRQIEKVISTFSAEERQLLERHPQMREDMKACYREACRSGCEGAALDAKLIFGPWGFGMGDVQGRVRIWNGGEDVHVPPAAARWMAERLPKAELRIYEGEGESHAGMMVRHADEILAELVAMRG